MEHRLDWQSNSQGHVCDNCEIIFSLHPCLLTELLEPLESLASDEYLQ